MSRTYQRCSPCLDQLPAYAQQLPLQALHVYSLICALIPAALHKRLCKVSWSPGGCQNCKNCQWKPAGIFPFLMAYAQGNKQNQEVEAEIQLLRQVLVREVIATSDSSKKTDLKLKWSSLSESDLYQLEVSAQVLINILDTQLLQEPRKHFKKAGVSVYVMSKNGKLEERKSLENIPQLNSNSGNFWYVFSVLRSPNILCVVTHISP